jgi:hypothetical protein
MSTGAIDVTHNEITHSDFGSVVTRLSDVMGFTKLKDASIKISGFVQAFHLSHGLFQVALQPGRVPFINLVSMTKAAWVQDYLLDRSPLTLKLCNAVVPVAYTL